MKSQKPASLLAQTQLGTEAEQRQSHTVTICTYSMQHAAATPTPGPWEVAHHGTTPANTSIEVQTETGLPVAVMSYCGSAEANAALIASAPDLLSERDRLQSELDAAMRIVVSLREDRDKLRSEWDRLSDALTSEVKAHHNARAAVEKLTLEVERLRAAMDDAAHRLDCRQGNIATHLRAALERSA